MTKTSEVTALLMAHRQGDAAAFDRLMPMLYDDLRRIARSQVRRSGGSATLNATGLVHEAYMRLVDQSRASWKDREHFLAVCAVVMRRIVISNARRRGAKKRGGDDRQVTVDEQEIATDDGEWLLDLDRALERLRRHNERLVRVVECRYFAGLTAEETAEALGASLRTVHRDWIRARAWLREELGGTRR